MEKVKRLIPALAVLFFVLCSAASGEGLKITYKYVYKNTSKYQAQIVNTMRGTVKTKQYKPAGQLDIILWPDWVYVAQDENVRMYDFENKLVYVFDKTKSTYYVTSLHGDVNSMMMDFQWLNAQGESLRKSGEKDEQEMRDKPAELEKRFGVYLPGSIRLQGIKTEKKDGVFEYAAGKDIDLGTVEFSKNRIPGNLERSFLHSICYSFNIHPELRNIVIKKRVAIQKIKYEYYERAVHHSLEFNLVGVEKSKDEPAEMLKNRKRSMLFDKPISDILLVAEKLPASSEGDAYAKASSFADESIKNRCGIDGIMALKEYTFDYRKNNPEKLGQIPITGKYIQDAKILQDAVNHIEIGGSGIAKKTSAINRKNLKKGYFIDLLTGISYMNEGKPIAAIPFFQKVLAENPASLSSWASLDIAYMTSVKPDIEKSWECFNAAYHLDPKCPLIASHIRFKDRLESWFPDLF